VGPEWARRAIGKNYPPKYQKEVFDFKKQIISPEVRSRLAS
jgi:hypothetical protein